MHYFSESQLEPVYEILYYEWCKDWRCLLLNHLLPSKITIMSDEEQLETEHEETTTRMLTAEYKDGKLQIVEVSPYQKGTKIEVQEIEAQGSESEDGQYMQVLDGDKNVVVDLLNLTLVRCSDGEESYRLVSQGEDDTVTCVLAEQDDDEADPQSYVVVEGEGEQGPLVFLQSDLRPEPRQKPVMSATEILERAKALQKAKTLLTQAHKPRRHKSALPPPHELLSSPGFKLFLYSCKLCSFKCNAIKDLTAHKAMEHGGGAGKWRGRAAASILQCARCPHRAATHSQLIKHVKEKHLEVGSSGSSSKLVLSEVCVGEVLVCGACGFESPRGDAFRKHVKEEHGVTAC